MKTLIQLGSTKMKKTIILLLVLASASFNSHALELVTAKVTVLEPTYLPGSISFQIDKSTSRCPAGRWIKWSKSEENNKAVYSTLLAALSSQNRINLYFDESDTECKASYLHILRN